MENHCLFALARAGDAAACAAVVEKMRPRLTSLAGHYARYSCVDEDDLLQEAWIGLLEALREVDLGIGSPEHYLVQCARWRLLDAGKRARRRQTVSLEESRFDGLPWEECAIDDDAGGAPENSVGEGQAAAFVATLTPLQQRIVKCLLRGMTWREAGAAMGCSSANIAYHMRAIKQRYHDWSDAGLP